MNYLMREYFEVREKIFFNGLNYIINLCSNFNTDHNYQCEIKILISNIGVRLYNKLVKDRIIEDKCYTDIKLACAEYNRLKQQGNTVKMTLISPVIADGFGEEEFHNILKIYENAGLDPEYTSCGDTKKPGKQEKEFDLYNSIDLHTGYMCGIVLTTRNFIWKWKPLSLLSGTCNPYGYNNYKLHGPHLTEYVFDLNAYINGIYDINDGKLTINTLFPEYTGSIDFIFKIYKEFIEMFYSVSGNRRKYYTWCCSGGQTDVDIYEEESKIKLVLTEEEKNIMDTLAQNGYINAHEGNYYINCMTQFLVPNIFLGNSAEVFNTFDYAIRVNWRERDAVERIIKLCTTLFNAFTPEVFQIEDFMLKFKKFHAFLIETRDQSEIKDIYRAWSGCFGQLENDCVFLDYLNKKLKI